MSENASQKVYLQCLQHVDNLEKSSQKTLYIVILAMFFCITLTYLLFLWYSCLTKYGTISFSSAFKQANEKENTNRLALRYEALINNRKKQHVFPH